MVKQKGPRPMLRALALVALNADPFVRQRGTPDSL